MHARELLLGLLWGLGLAALVWAIGQSVAQMTYVTLADGRRQERRLPLLYRILLPLAPNVAPLADRPALREWRISLDRRLTAAGFEGLLSGRELIALRLLMPLVIGPVVIGIAHVLVANLPGRLGAALQARVFLLHVLLLVWLFLRPGLWLRRTLAERHRSVRVALPFVLDLLTLSVEAGLDFMTAMKRIIDRRAVDPLGEELIRVFREVQLGKTRREALRDMAERVDQPDLRSVSHALIQADELGVSIGAILRIQSDQMRVRRFLHAEKLANEAPVRMLFPLIGFIFPSVLIVLLGPVFLQILQHGI